MTNIKASCDSKVRQFRSHKNSVGHMVGRESGGCPDATGLCESACYVQSTFRYPAVKKILQENLNALLNCEKVEEYVNLLEPLVESSLQQYARARKRSKKLLSRDEKGRFKTPTKEERVKHELLLRRGHIFRWHWAGDILNLEHAKAIKIIADLHPETKFWIYTRTWWATGVMRDTENLHVYLSVDAENSQIMRKAKENFPWVKLAFMTPEKLNLPQTVTCPATNGKLETEGACQACTICYNTDKNVEFLIHK